MTISSTVRIAGPYIGSGAATVFPFAFKVFAAAEMQVAKLNTTSNVETILVLTTDYTVQLNGDQNSNPGGTITLPSVLASGYNLTITSDIANLQPTDLTNQGGFYPEVITDALDRATIQIQQLDQNSRAIKIPLSDGVLDMTTPVVSARQGKYLAFDSLGLPVVSAGTGSDSALRTDLANATAVSAGSRLSGFRQTGTGATARTVDDKLKETVSVKDFGAVGDGVTNDTTAIQNALNSGASNIYISPGTYAVSALSINSNQTIFGCGKASILLATIATSDGPTGVVNITSKSNIEIYNITVAGINRPYNNDPTLGDGDRGISCASSSNIDIHDCEVYGFWSFGIVFSACANIFATNNYVYNIGNESNISIANASTKAIVSNNICLNGKLYGIEVENLNVGVTVTGNYIENCSSGISINYCGNVTVTGNTVIACNNTNTVSGSTGVGLNYNGTAAKPLYNITTTGNVISGNNNLALSITGGHDNLIFTGNTFTNAVTNATGSLIFIEGGSGTATNVNFSGNTLNCKNVSNAFTTSVAISNYLFTGNNVLNPYGNVFFINAGSLYNNFQIPKLLNASIANVPNIEVITTSLENRFWSPDKSEQFLLIFGGLFSRPIKSIFKEKIIGVYWCFNANNVTGQWILSVNGVPQSAAINGVVGQEIWNFQALNIISNAGTTNTFSIANTVGNIYGDYVKFRIVAL